MLPCAQLELCPEDAAPPGGGDGPPPAPPDSCLVLDYAVEKSLPSGGFVQLVAAPVREVYPRGPLLPLNCEEAE